MYKALAEFLRDAGPLTDVVLVVLGWIAWMLYKSFRAGSWYSKHEQRLDGFDKALADALAWREDVDERFEAASARYSRLASAVQAQPDAFRVELERYATREVIGLMADESKNDRARLWRAVEELRRERHGH